MLSLDLLAIQTVVERIAEGRLELTRDGAAGLALRLEDCVERVRAMEHLVVPHGARVPIGMIVDGKIVPFRRPPTSTPALQPEGAS